MAVQMLSQITASGTNFTSGTDVLVGVRSGTTDLTWTVAQIAAGVSAALIYTTTISGNVSAAAWTTTGIGLVGAAASFTDTSSSGTVTTMYVHRLGIPTILASSATTYTNAYGLWVEQPTASTNVTITNKFAAGFNGNILVGNVISNTGGSASAPISWNGNNFYWGSSSGAGARAAVSLGGETSWGAFQVAANGGYGFCSTSNGLTGSTDTIITRGGAAATLQFGGADAAAPVAQTIQAQSVVAGTAATAGADLTIQGSRPTGASVGGSIIFKVAGGTGSGTAQTAASQQFAITGNGNIVLGNAAIATNATDGFLYCDSGAGTPTGTPTTFTGRVPLYVDTTNSQLWLFLGGAWKQPKTPAGAATVTWQ